MDIIGDETERGTTSSAQPQDGQLSRILQANASVACIIFGIYSIYLVVKGDLGSALQPSPVAVAVSLTDPPVSMHLPLPPPLPSTPPSPLPSIEPSTPPPVLASPPSSSPSAPPSPPSSPSSPLSPRPVPPVSTTSVIGASESSPSPPPLFAPGWVKHEKLNCYGWRGHGAKDLPSLHQKSAIALAECQAACVMLDSCTAIVVARHDAHFSYKERGEPMTCFRRTAVDLDKCESSADYDVFTLTPEASKMLRQLQIESPTLQPPLLQLPPLQPPPLQPLSHSLGSPLQPLPLQPPVQSLGTLAVSSF